MDWARRPASANGVPSLAGPLDGRGEGTAAISGKPSGQLSMTFTRSGASPDARIIEILKVYFDTRKADKLPAQQVRVSSSEIER